VSNDEKCWRGRNDDADEGVMKGSLLSHPRCAAEQQFPDGNLGTQTPITQSVDFIKRQTPGFVGTQTRFHSCDSCSIFIILVYLFTVSSA